MKVRKILLENIDKIVKKREIKRAFGDMFGIKNEWLR